MRAVEIDECRRIWVRDMATGVIALIALIAVVPRPLPANQPTPEQTLARLERGLAVAPDHPGLLLQASAALARLGRDDRALETLEKALATGADIDLDDEPAFQALRSGARLAALRARADAARSAAGRPVAAFRLSEAEMVPEGIAYDPVERTVFVGSIAKREILAIDAAGRSRRFAGPDAGLQQVLGMHVDAARRLLWAATAIGEMSGGSRPSGSLVALALPGGRVVRRVELDDDEAHFPNDVAVAADGTVYLTDTAGGGVYRLRPGGAALERLTAPGTTAYANGIALDPRRSRLYVASFPQGLAIVALPNGAVRPLGHPPGVTLHGVDGLILDGDALIAVQNSAGAPRIVRFPLSADGERVTGCEVLARRGGPIGLPTTAVLAGRDLLFVGDSLVDLLERGALRKDPRVVPPTVLRLALDR